MTVYALRLENGADTATRMRFGDALGLVPNGTPLGARSGLRPDGGGTVAVTAGSMQVTVDPFAAWIDGTASDAQAGYPFLSDAVVTLAVDPGDATQARVDTVVARVQDNAYDAGGATVATVELVKGTPGAGVPLLPANTIALRDVNVPAGASAGTGGLSSSNLGADRRKYISSLGGILPVASATERDALPTLNGQVVYRFDTGKLQVRTGAGWLTVATEPVGLPAANANATLNTGTQTAWTTDTDAATVTFTAPASGQVEVTLSAYIVNTAASGSTGNARSGLKVSGGLTRDPADGESVAARGGGVGGTFSRTFLLTGLTAGTSYTLTSAHKCDSTAAWYCTDRAVFVRAA